MTSASMVGASIDSIAASASDVSASTGTSTSDAAMSSTAASASAVSATTGTSRSWPPTAATSSLSKLEVSGRMLTKALAI